MEADSTDYESPAIRIARVRTILLELQQKVRSDRAKQFADDVDLDHCLDLIHQAEAESEASDVAYIAGHLDAAIEHVEIGLALCTAAAGCLGLGPDLNPPS